MSRQETASRAGPAAAALPIHDRVRAQAACIASAAFTVLLPSVLVALTATSAWTGWVNVMAMHTYLDRPEVLPGVMWAVPIAVQVFIFVGEATMVLNSVLRRRWVIVSGAGAAAAGYGAEVGAHLYYGEAADTIIAMTLAAIACGGGWALAAALMDRGVAIANGETPDTDQSTASAPITPLRNSSATDHRQNLGPSSAPTRQPAADARAGRNPTAANATWPPGRRTRRELLEEVRALAPERPTLSPNYVATHVGVSWRNAKSLLAELGRLPDRESAQRPLPSAPASPTPEQTFTE